MLFQLDSELFKRTFVAHSKRSFLHTENLCNLGESFLIEIPECQEGLSFRLQPLHALIQDDKTLVFGHLPLGRLHLLIRSVLFVGKAVQYRLDIGERRSCRPAKVAVDLVGGYPIQPGGDGNAGPPESTEVLKGLGERLCRQILGHGDISNPIQDIAENPGEMRVIYLAEGLRISLAPGYQIPLLASCCICWHCLLVPHGIFRGPLTI